MNSKDIAAIVVGIVGFFAWPFIAVWWLIVEPMTLIVRLVKGSEWGAERKARQLTHKLYEDVKKVAVAVPSKEDFGKAVCDAVIDEVDDDTCDRMIVAALELYDMEEVGVAAIPEPPAVCNSIEGGRYRDFLSRYAANVSNTRGIEVAQRIVASAMLDLARHFPVSEGDDLSIALTDVLHDQLPLLVENLAMSFYRAEAIDLGIFRHLREQLNRNLCQASGLPAIPEYYDSAKTILPTRYKGDNVVHAYLKHTPLLPLFGGTVGYAIPAEARFQTQWILAAQGSGKSVYIEHQISQIISKVLEGQASIIVMDSQEKIINKIKRIAVLAERMVWIDAEDIEYPVAINMFDLGMTGGLSPLEQEQQYNSTLTLCMFILEALIGSELTGKQSVPFRYLIAACMAIPDATILTFQDILENGTGDYQQYINHLDESVRDFFKTQFASPEFKKTRGEIAWRISGILAIPSLRRMFVSENTKCDLFAEMNAGKVILINTARSTLQPQGCEVFGRFWLALIAMAAERRFTINRPIPCHVFIDEVDDYYQNKKSDASIETIVQKCRKQKVALTIANRSLNELPQNVRDTLQTAAIKCVANLTNSDAHAMAPGMRSRAEDLMQHSVGTFSVYVRNVTPTAVRIDVPFGVLDDMERMSEAEYEVLKSKMRSLYAAVPAKKEEPKKEEPKTQQLPQEGTADAVDIVHDTDASTTVQSEELDAPKQAIVRSKKRKPKKADKDNIDTSASPQW